MPSEVARFGDGLELDRGAYELRRSGRALRLERIPLEILFLLVERRGQLVSREDIIERVWGKDVFLDTDSSINGAIRKIRQALKDDPENPVFVQTVTGKGYRFIATVRGTSVPGATHRVMLAVLPFANLSNDPEQEYFSDGLTEETIADLGQLSPEQLGIIARTSAMAYKHTNKAVTQIGQELGVDYILEGSVRRDGGKVRITAQLIRVADQTHLWAQNYDRQVTDFLEVQNELGQEISRQVGLRLTPREKSELETSRKVNPEAYDLYMKGNFFWNKRTREGVERAMQYFRQALDRDPNYALAYVGIAHCYRGMPIMSDVPSTEAFPKAKAAALKALEIDPRLADAHANVGYIKTFFDWDWEGSRTDYHRALQLNPNSSIAHLGYAILLSILGEHKEALAEADQALRLDPLSLLIGALKGQLFFQARQYRESVEQLQKTLEIDPNFWIAQINLGKALQVEGRTKEAIEAFLKAAALAGGATEAISLAGYTYAISGQCAEAERILRELKASSEKKYVPPYNVAMVCHGLGDSVETLGWLHRAYEERDVHMVFLRVDPKWDNLRADPGFVALLQRMNLSGGETRKGSRFLATVKEASVAPNHRAGTGSSGTKSGAIEPGLVISHYRLEEKVASGGMGDVFQAEDIRLGRRVAIKFLSEKSASDSHALERFLLEARAASSLNHPNICTIYEIEEHAGRPVIVMELLQGETLRQRIRRGSVEAEQVLDVGIHVADALQAAHAKGIIHRDIKPGNIFITQSGQVKVLDFGLAKLTTGHAVPVDDGQEPLTMHGVLPGTRHYMSPEQLRDEELDGRSDIFSLGIVLYEMATGTKPFTGKNSFAVIDATLNSRPAAAQRLNPKVSAELDAILSKALEKKPGDRYQNAWDMRADLQDLKRDTHAGRLTTGAKAVAAPEIGKRWRIIIPAVVVVLALSVSYVYLHRAPKLTNKDTIILADFTNTTGDAVFDGTLRQGISVQLEQSPFLSLISVERIQQVLRMMGQPADARLTPEIAREVCERTASAAVLDGSITNLGSQYVIGLRAKNCRTGDILDEEQVQAARKEDVLKALSQIASKFRARVGESLATVRKYDTPLAEATTPSLDALRAYSAAWKVAFSTGYAEAIPLLKRATEIDPKFAMAHAFLGRVYGDSGESVLSAESTTRAFQLRDRASDREKFFITATYDQQVTGSLEDSQQTCELWAQTYPREVTPHGLLSGFTYQGLGKYDKSIEEAKTAIALDPDFVPGYTNLAFSYVYLDRLGEAGATLKRASERKLEIPDLMVLRYYVAFLKGDSAVMQREAAASQGNSGAEDWISQQAAFVSAYSGQLQHARRLSQHAVRLAQQQAHGERAAIYEAGAAIWEAFFGNAPAARQSAMAALELSKGRDIEYGAAFARARSGDSALSQTLANDLESRFGEDTSVRFSYLPTLRALVALNHGEPSRAIELLQIADSHDLAVPASGFFGFFGALYPAYVRGEAYLALHRGAEAAAEFQKIIDHRGIVIGDPVGAAVHLELARSYAMQGETLKAKAAYQDFLTLWKDADLDIPILKQAKAEYGKLPTESANAGQRVMLAVLPFANLSADPEQEYFSDGLTEETITDLGELSPQKLGVIARTSAMAYKHTNKTIGQIGRELGVDYALEGSVRRDGTKARITAQLIRVKDQTHIWAQNYDRELKDLLDVQNELGKAIAQQVRLELTPAQQVELTKTRTVDPEAYDLYFKGLYNWNLITPTGFKAAAGYFQQAISKDPNYAPPYAGLVDCYAMLPMIGDAPPRESFPAAQAASTKAVQLDDSLAEAHDAASRIKFYYEWDWLGAEKEAMRAISLDGNLAGAHLRYAHFLSNLGRHDQALAEGQRAIELDPINLINNALLGMFLYQARQYDASIVQVNRTLQMNPNFWVALFQLGKAYEQKGRYQEAIAAFTRARDLSGGNSEAAAMVGHAYALAGNKGEAQRVLKELEERSRHTYVPPCNIALLYAALGDNDQATQWLEKGYEARDIHMIFLKVDARWDSLRANPHFQDLLRRMNFPQ